ncbi:MAG TPA: 3-hydroxyacyl-CoA dehydrogenase NAD-binding domain-containing protein [Chryseolinea sp.]
MKVDSIKSIAVVGAGTMGQGIAQVCAQAGYAVMLYDTQPEITRNAIANIRKNYEGAVEEGKLTSDKKDNALHLIQAVGDFRQLQVELAIEAVVERLDVKQKIICELEKLNAKDCILVSNTSSFPITLIASGLKHKDRFAGLHFFNPAHTVNMVEIIQGSLTSQNTVDVLRAFASSISKPSVISHDSPGFIVDRISIPFFLESLKMVEDGISDFKTIDALCRSTGFRMGPFELMDDHGIDRNLAMTSSMYQAFYYDPKFRPSRIQQKKVDAGHNGKKSGRGFYDYADQ